MTAQSTATATGPRFVRRTTLAPHEYRKNFHQIDREVMTAIASPEADRVTPLMSKIYLRLVSAPTECWEGPGTLYFTSKMIEGKQIKASKVLYEVLGVASATAHKALTWMHEQGIIGYSSGKNGAGIRIFLNRAAGSIGVRAPTAGEKILPFAQGSNSTRAGSKNEPAFNDSFAVLEVLDLDLNPAAPKIGAVTPTVKNRISKPNPQAPPSPVNYQSREASTTAPPSGAVTVNELIARLKSELEPCVKSVAAQAAAQATAREVTQTRRWFEERALPKAIRVAQHETYNLLRKLGTLDERKEHARLNLQLGRGTDDYTVPEAKLLTPEEITEAAEACLALLETQDKQIDVTLAEISLEGGSWLLPEDAPKVRAEAERLLNARGERGSSCSLR